MSVFWTRGYRREGGALQMGLIVVRPGWVAFLPIGAPMGAAEQFALGASRGSLLSGPGMIPANALRMDMAWQGRYPIMGWWQHGLHVLDEEVRRALDQPGAVMITTAEGGLVQKKLIPAAFTAGPIFITLDQAPPPELLAPWPPGVMPLDKGGVKKTIALFCVLFVLLGAGCEAIGIAAEGSFQIWPIGFWGFVLLLTVGLLLFRVRAHQKELDAQQRARAVGPYR